MSRSLVARFVGGDWPGTFGVRAAALIDVGGWDHDVLVENLEMWRTAQVAGMRVSNRPDLVVQRCPPTTRQFRGQRLRQAYDDMGQPVRLVVELALLPTVIASRRRPLTVGRLAASAVVAAAFGKRRWRPLDTPWDVPLWAPLWLAERSILVWVALATRLLRGGVVYHGRTIRVAAHSRGALRRRAGAREEPLGYATSAPSSDDAAAASAAWSSRWRRRSTELSRQSM